MNGFIRTLGSSIGKKLLMAVTGLSFCGFLFLHLIGNLFIYGGEDAFNGYAAHLHSLGPVFHLVEIVLLSAAILHVFTGLTLYYQNLKARPVRYNVNAWAGGRTIGSATMPYTGVILLAFIILHLVNFHFVDKTHTTIFQLVSDAFSHPPYVIIYVAGVIIAGIHISHGFWSAFQTLGISHVKYTPFIKYAGMLFTLIVAVGFGIIPVYMFIIM